MVKLNRALTFLFIVVPCLVFAQNRHHVVYFKNKANTTFSLSNASAYLSQRALDRRTIQNIAIDSTDIPVNSSYVAQVAATGASVVRTSKWFNAVVVVTDSTTLNQILALPFVNNQERILKRAQPPIEFDETPIESEVKSGAKTTVLDYGQAQDQTFMLSAQYMHNDGFTGAGMWIGVFDSGFRNADTLMALSKLFNENRVLATYDIVDGDNTVYDAHNHGTSVLSCMAAHWPGQMIGTAFDASYALFRTEDVSSETQLEEFNWLVAAEIADSMGIDVINTSLGYSTFDDSQFNHDYNDLNGQTTIISKAASIAAEKGILCVNSAGNEGNGSWFYITSPADALGILTVGAVTSDSVLAGFSSRGPSSDGRIKPDVVAQGSQAAVASSGGGIVRSSGTSFSSPIMAGFAASLWQSMPNLKNSELIDLIRNSSNRANNPGNDYGYGIPNYLEFSVLSGLASFPDNSDYVLFPNPLNGTGKVFLKSSPKMMGWPIDITLYNALGEKMKNWQFVNNSMEQELVLPSESKNSGVYFFKISSVVSNQVIKVVNQ